MRRRGRDGRGEGVHDARGAVRGEEPAAVEGRQAVGKERLCKERKGSHYAINLSSAGNALSRDGDPEKRKINASMKFFKGLPRVLKEKEGAE